jgi:hypothetical protein
MPFFLAKTYFFAVFSQTAFFSVGENIPEDRAWKDFSKGI